ncbi:MAG: purine phosphoribosyltransferase family protein [Alistipes sp.]|nr:purine phosphoribosyltransferase family protein [Alistipes sp.]
MINTLKFYQDFPKKGIKFIDIIPLLQNKAVYKQLIDRLTQLTTAANVATPEARGFLFASSLLLTNEKVQNIVPIRKSGKLPFNEGDLIEVRIEKEYGIDTLYYRRSDIAAGKPEGDVFEITLFDDVLATGGTAEGVARSMESMKILVDGKEYGVKIKEFIFLVHLEELGGKARLEGIAPVHTLMDI